MRQIANTKMTRLYVNALFRINLKIAFLNVTFSLVIARAAGSLDNLPSLLYSGVVIARLCRISFA